MGQKSYPRIQQTKSDPEEILMEKKVDIQIAGIVEIRVICV
ncbi:MAG: hypothetical protein AB7S48_14685 [Bacteroidales bacterium]